VCVVEMIGEDLVEQRLAETGAGLVGMAVRLLAVCVYPGINLLWPKSPQP
jgi:hypothetical protein